MQGRLQVLKIGTAFQIKNIEQHCLVVGSKGSKQLWLITPAV